MYILPLKYMFSTLYTCPQFEIYVLSSKYVPIQEPCEHQPRCQVRKETSGLILQGLGGVFH